MFNECNYLIDRWRSRLGATASGDASLSDLFKMSLKPNCGCEAQSPGVLSPGTHTQTNTHAKVVMTCDDT